MGDVVLTELLKARDLLPSAELGTEYWVAAEDESLLPEVMTVAGRLRAKSRSVEYALKAQTLARQLKTASSAGAKPPAHPAWVKVGLRPAGQPLAPGFVGLSIEYPALHEYTGSNPNAVDPATVALIRALSPGQRPVLRIGGDSADYTWWPQPGEHSPPGATYRLTDNWLATVRALAVAVNSLLATVW